MAFTALALILASCAAPSTPVPSPSPTPTPSNTPIPTLTPSPSPSPSATADPSQTPAGSTALDCALLMQSVKNGAHYKPREQFSINWKVRNSGALGWDSGTIDFTYIAGTRMYQYPLIHLQGTVDPGNISHLIADMRAPKNPGKYSTTWSLLQGDTYFCHVSLTIFVD